jgi:hypothetical protein
VNLTSALVRKGEKAEARKIMQRLSEIDPKLADQLGRELGL